METTKIVNTKKVKKVWEDFRDFAVKGNAFDLAVGVVIGAAFKDVVTAIVDGIIMPPLNFLTNKVNFTDLYINLSRHHYDSLKQAEDAGAAIIKYGLLINTLVKFLIISIVIFAIIKLVSKLRREEKEEDVKEEKKEVDRKCSYCDSVISKKAIKCPFCTADLKKPKKFDTIKI